MSKAIGTILTVVAIGVAIASGVGAIGAATAAIIGAGVAAAQFVNSSVLASRAKDALQQRQASVAALQLGEVAREGIFGEVMTGGSLVDAFNWGGQWGTDWECRIIAVADHLCDALVGYFVNDTFVRYTGDGAVPGYNGQLEVYWRAGAVIQSVPQVVLANGPGWTANDFGSGVAWVVVCYKADKADAKNPVWPGGRPGFTWVVRGKRCYQARKDSTIGGSGAHRWSDPSTWEWTDNPIDCRHNWVRGIYAGDRVGDPDMLLVGRGLSSEEAPPVNVFAAASVCDELVGLDAGGSEKRYRLNGLVRADEAYIEVEDHFAAACAGVILQPEGAVEIEPGQAKSPVFFFSDEDLIVGSSVEYSDDLSEADDSWVNTVAPRYVDPALKYSDHAAPIRRVVADVLADGGPREQPLSLTMVTSSTQAGRVGEIARRLGRLLRRGKVTLGPAFAEVEEGDWGVWTSERYLKGKSVMFRVEAYALDEKWQNTLTLREIVRDVYARDADAASTAVALQQDAPSIGAPAADAWAAAAIVTGAEGRSMPAIAVTGKVDSDYADLVRFEYCLADAGGPPANARWIEAGFAGPDAQRFEITGVAASTGYAVAVSYVVGRVPGVRRVLPTVTTMAASVGWTDISDPDGTRPDPNATNSADPNSPFGPGGSVNDALQHFKTIDDAIERVREELGGAGGLTQAAIDARDAARLAATNSATARDESQAARDAANTASGQALSSAKAAAGSAGTAEGQATIASTKATAATEQASIATAKATVATTKAGEASTSASNAATSEQNAGGSATAAATSAKTAADASDAAGRSASAASTSQSSAAASAGDAGQKASAAAESATSAGTSAGQANTSAGQAATSATNASGSATVASIAATVAASSATGNLVKHGDFSDGNAGYWLTGPYESRMIRPRDYGQTLPPGQEWVYLMRGLRDVLEQNPWNGNGPGPANGGLIERDWSNRVLRVHAVASAEFSPYDAVCGFFGFGPDMSVLQFGGVGIAPAGRVGYSTVTSDVVVSPGVTKILPWIQNSGPPGFETQEGRWARFSMHDVTEEVRAGQSASAAAGSATTAGTRADDAGRSASAAQTSYTNAEASNRGAAASAQSAAGSASAADGSRASAASYSEQAASFRDQAGGSAASAKSSADAAASSTGALSQRVDEVATDVEGAKSSASSALTAVNDVKTGLSGARLRYVAQSSGGRAIFELVSDNAGGARWQLGGDGLIDGNLMLTGSLTGPKIAQDAISGTASVERGSLALRNTALTDAASVGYTGNGGRASITFSGIVTLSPGAAAGTRMQAYLFINGNTKIGPLPISAQRGSPAPFCFTTLADISGQVTVTLSVQATNGSGSGDPHLVDNPTIILLEMKKLGG